jgi:3'-5' exoribonuclease
MTLLEIIQKTRDGAADFSAVLACQLVEIKEGVTKNGKPFLDISFSDGSAQESIKIWQDSPAYETISGLKVKDCVELEGNFWRNQFGLNIDKLQIRKLDETQRKNLFAGPPERQKILAQDFALIEETVAAMRDPRLRLVCQAYLQQYGERFRRAAAARDYHHARRGGLLEHVAQMTRAGLALRAVYTHLNWDLILVGILFHDCGKLWENDYEAEGFVSPISSVGELLGHISIGIELVNKLWRGLETEKEFSAPGSPTREQAREHLLHLIASHHGQREFGAPVTPRTPEAWMLHYIDNIDAKMEIMRSTYEEKPQIAPGIFDYRRPLEGHAVEPLAAWKPAGA